MKVGFAVSDLARGGGQILITSYANALAASGHEVYLAVSEGPNDLLPELDHRVIVVDRRNLDGLPQLDLALATWWATGLWVMEMPADAYGQFMQSVEDRFYSSEDHEARRRAGLVQTLGWPTITESAWIRDYLATVVPTTHVELVRNGVDKQLFPPTRRPPRTSSDPLRVVVEGTSVWFKGVDAVFSGLAGTRVPIEIDYVSAQQLIDEDIGAKLSSNPMVVRRTQHGSLTQTEFAQVLRNSDVFVKFSRVEGMPGPPLEAMHCGCVVVATPVSGIEEYAVHGYNSLLVPFDDPAALANWLEVLHEKPDMVDLIRHRAYETATAWPTMGESAELFEIALGKIRDIGFNPLTNQEAIRRVWNGFLASGEASARVWRPALAPPNLVGIDHEASFSGDSW